MFDGYNVNVIMFYQFLILLMTATRKPSVMNAPGGSTNISMLYVSGSKVMPKTDPLTGHMHSPTQLHSAQDYLYQ